MKTLFLSVLAAAALLTGCVAGGPAISKSSMGNLDISVSVPEGMDVHAAEIRVDGVFVGNVSGDLPVLYLKRGCHNITVTLAGLKPYQQAIEILGDPNHQYLNVSLKK